MGDQGRSQVALMPAYKNAATGDHQESEGGRLPDHASGGGGACVQNSHATPAGPQILCSPILVGASLPAGRPAYCPGAQPDDKLGKSRPACISPESFRDLIRSPIWVRFCLVSPLTFPRSTGGLVRLSSDGGRPAGKDWRFGGSWARAPPSWPDFSSG